MPETIGNYRLMGEIGAGGMGVVYRAEHVALKQSVVVKKLLPHHGANPSAVARFLQEARVAASIDDPGIVKVFDLGTLPDGSSYIVMELLTGETLSARLKRAGRLPLAVATVFSCQAATAVGAAHRNGVVHRDLKPDNLFIVRDREVAGGERIKVLDFGIAKLSQAPSGLTMTGIALGTPAYMAPEQWRSASRVDERADVYSLGCILYEMVCGRRPFLGPDTADYIDQHRYEMPTKPSGLVGGLPRELDEVLRVAMAKNPDDRFRHMEAFRGAVENLGGPVEGVEGDAFDSPDQTVPLADAGTRTRHPTPVNELNTPVPRTRAGAITPQMPRPRSRDGVVVPRRRVMPAILAVGAVLVVAVAALAIRSYSLSSSASRGSNAAEAVHAGDREFKNHQYLKAVEYYEQAAAAGDPTPNRAKAEAEARAEEIARALDRALASGDFDRARALYEKCTGETSWFCAQVQEKAEQVKAGYTKEHLAKAEMAKAADKPDLCKQELQQVLAFDGTNAEAKSAQCGTQQARADKSAASHREESSSPAQRDKKANQLIQEGNAKVMAKDYEGAVSKYHAALALKPTASYVGYAYRGLGTAAVYAGDTRAAVKWYKLYMPYADAATKQQLQQLIDKFGG